MNNNFEQEHKELTPNEQAAARARVVRAFLKEQETFSPPQQPDGGDLVHENKRVMGCLVNVIGYLPVLAGVIMLASMVVSADKTAAAFHASVANARALWGAWAFIVMISSVVMAEFALVVSEFMLVRDMLSKNLHREIFTLAELRRKWRVFSGSEPPRDYHEMPDPALRLWSTFLFWLVVASNVYAVTRATHIRALSDLTFENGLLIFTGIAGALSLRMVGQLMARIVYELARKREGLEVRDILEQWRADQMAEFEQYADSLIAEELHRIYCRKNRIPTNAGSPYRAGEVVVDDAPFMRVGANSNGRH